MAKCKHCGRRAIMFSDICSQCWDREQEAARRGAEGADVAAPVASVEPDPTAVPDPTLYESLDRFALAHPGPLAMAILCACVVFGVFTLTGDAESTWARQYAWGAQVNEDVQSGEWWRLLAATFLHGGWDHLLFNMYALFVVGSVAEQAFGWSAFLAIYVLSGLGGSIASYFLVDVPSLGASGAIFGLFGAMLYLTAWGDEIPGLPISRDALKRLGAWAAYSLFMGFTHPHINNIAHLGGLATGTVTAAVTNGRVGRALAIVCGTMLLLTGMRMTVSGSHPAPQMSALVRASNAARRNDLDSAIADAGRAIPMPQALVLRAELRLRKGDYQGALDDTDALLATNVRGEIRLIGHYYRAHALLALNQLPQAYSTVKPVLESENPRLREQAEQLKDEILRLARDSASTQPPSLHGNLRMPAESVPH